MEKISSIRTIICQNFGWKNVKKKKEGHGARCGCMPHNSYRHHEEHCNIANKRFCTASRKEKPVQHLEPQVVLQAPVDRRMTDFRCNTKLARWGNWPVGMVVAAKKNTFFRTFLPKGHTLINR